MPHPVVIIIVSAVLLYALDYFLFAGLYVGAISRITRAIMHQFIR